MKIIIILLLLFYPNIIYADVFDLCSNPEPLQVLLFVKYFITIVKIIVPISIILFGSIDLIKAIISSDADAMNKSLKALVKRTISGIIIFFLPTLITLVLNLLNSDFSMCDDNLNQETINSLKQGLIQENNAELEKLAKINAERQKNEANLLSGNLNQTNTLIETNGVTKGVWFIQQWEGHGDYCGASQSEFKAYNIGDGTITCGYGVTNHLSSLATNNGYGQYFPMSEGSCYPVNSINSVQSIFIGQLYSQLDNYLGLYNISLEQHQKDALVSIGYQSGSSVMKSCVAAYANGGNEGLWNKIKDRVKGNGKVYPGLYKRRDGEYNLFLTGEYDCGFYNRTLKYY